MIERRLRGSGEVILGMVVVFYLHICVKSSIFAVTFESNDGRAYQQSTSEMGS